MRARRSPRVLPAAVVWVVACVPGAPPPLTDDERALGAAVGLAESTLTAIRAEARSTLSPLIPLDSMGDALPPRGVTVGVAERRTTAVLARLREGLGPDLLVFLAERGYGMHPDSIGVLRSRDPLDMLRARSTNGLNYDVDTDSVIRRVQGWRDTLGFTLHGAGYDWLEGRFPGRQPDWGALARELFALCPDIVEQGTGTVEALEADLRRSGMLYCWWD